jgi:hypothetical protein
MIKENELRIGNLVMDFEDSQKYHPIECIYLNMHDKYWVSYRNNSIKCSVESLEPIPLTEEWLLKMGFDISNSSGYNIKNNGIEIDVWFNDDGLINDIQISSTNISGAYPNIKHFQYVHQLQNLYWCLCGEELKLDHNEVR